MGWPQGWSAWVQKIFPPLRFNPCMAQPVASCYRVCNKKYSFHAGDMEKSQGYVKEKNLYVSTNNRTVAIQLAASHFTT